MSQGIFISYRRDDTRVIAGRLYEALKAAFPKKKIFFDVDIPEPGNEIIAKIVRELQSSQVVIALIGPQWNANNRLDSAHDFVRRELKSALDLRRQDGLKILPVLVDGAKIPSEQLPHDLDRNRRAGISRNHSRRRRRQNRRRRAPAIAALLGG